MACWLIYNSLPFISNSLPLNNPCLAYFSSRNFLVIWKSSVTVFYIKLGTCKTTATAERNYLVLQHKYMFKGVLIPSFWKGNIHVSITRWDQASQIEFSLTQSRKEVWCTNLFCIQLVANSTQCMMTLFTFCLQGYKTQLH